MSDDFFKQSDLIYSYSRAEALEDGVLVDETQWASDGKGFLCGFTIPVAFTRALFEILKDAPLGEDLRGRAHDVLFMASLAARSAKETGESRKTFTVNVTNKNGIKTLLELFIDIGPGDKGEPVITIGFSEDF